MFCKTWSGGINQHGSIEARRARARARGSQDHLFNNIQAELANAGSSELLNDPVAFGAIDHGQRLRLGQDSVFHADLDQERATDSEQKEKLFGYDMKTKGRRSGGTIDCESGAAFLSHFFSAGQSAFPPPD